METTTQNVIIENRGGYYYIVPVAYSEKQDANGKKLGWFKMDSLDGYGTAKEAKQIVKEDPELLLISPQKWIKLYFNK